MEFKEFVRSRASNVNFLMLEFGVALGLFIAFMANQDYTAGSWEFRRIKIESVSEASTVIVRSFD